MSRSVESLHRRVLVRSVIPWAVVLFLLVLANWNGEGQQDRVVELGLTVAGAALAFDVSALTTRECMEYLGQLPVERGRSAASPYRSALLVIGVLAIAVHAIESSGAMYLVLRLVPESARAPVVYHHRPLAPWINLVGFPALSFELSWRVIPWFGPASRKRPLDPWVVLLVLIALLMPLTCVPWSLVGNESVQSGHYEGAWQQNLPGVACLVVALALHARNRSRQASLGFESFRYRSDAWES